MVHRLAYKERQRRQEMIDQLRKVISNLPFASVRQLGGQLCLVEPQVAFTFAPDPDAECTVLARFEDSRGAHLTAMVAGVLGGRVAALHLLTLLESAIGLTGVPNIEDTAMELLEMLVAERDHDHKDLHKHE